MNPAILALIGIMLASLAAIPFVTPQFESDYAPTGSLLLNSSNFEVSQSDMSEIPGSEHTSYGPDGFVKEIETPYGKFRFISNYEKIVRELLKPDEKVTVTETCDSISWVLQKRDASLNITQTPESIVEKFSMPNGWIKTVKENGSVSETWSGLNFTLINETFISVNQTLWDRVKKIEEMTNGVLGNVTTTTTTTIPQNIIINEFMPNPGGDDDAPMPGGEWVELYNPTNNDVNVSDWVLYDSFDTHELYINTSNTNSGDTIVPANGWLVVYRDGDGDFTLDNNGDEIRLYDGYPVNGSTLIDQISYASSQEGVSWARIPDGTGSLQEDSTPTPGETNE